MSILSKFAALKNRFLKSAVPISPATTPPATIPAPPSFSLLNVYPWLRTIYNNNTSVGLATIANILHSSLHYSSNGQVNFVSLVANNFQTDPSSVADTNCQNLIRLSLLFFRTFLRSGTNPQTQIPSQQIINWIDLFQSSPSFTSLSQINPSSELAKRVPGGIQSRLINALKYLTSANQSATPPTK